MKKQESWSTNFVESGHFFICVIANENDYKSSSINGVL